ncbi:hypothetical protein N510_001607 [Firmicutes bacterium ASF500]|nr:hypothetical protein N510_001607 [Firmicutes bacterium ASF500]
MAETLVLGNGFSITTDSTATQLNNNILVVGPSGSGKTMSYAEMCLLKTNNSSLIVTLSKRRLVNKYLSYYQDKGYRVYDLNLVEPSAGNVSYDPMYYVKSTADVTYLARSIIMANPKKKDSKEADPFWDDAAQSLLSALIAYQMHVKTRPTFTDVLDLFSTLHIVDQGDRIETNLDTLFDRLNQEEPNCFAYQCWKTFRFSPTRTASCIYSSLSVTVDTIFRPELKQAMSHEKPVIFENLAREKSILFVTTSAVNPSLNAFAGVFYSHAVKQLFEYAESREDGILEIPVHLLCDDFAVGAQIPDFAQFISIFREKQISVSILLQSESQLRAMYGENDAITIINNCDHYIYLGGMDLLTCQNIALRLNLPLSDVLYMPLGTEYIFERGSTPIKTERYSITEDPEWQKISLEIHQ